MSRNLDSLLSKEEKDQFKSEGERKIAELFDRYNIKYKYEQGVLVTIDEKPKIWHADYFLPEYGIYVEYYGLAGNQDYDKGIERKNKTYSEMGIEVIPVYPSDFSNGWQSYILNQIYTISKNRLEMILNKSNNTIHQLYAQCRNGSNGYSDTEIYKN